MTYPSMLALTEEQLTEMGVAAAGARRKIVLSMQRLKDRDELLAAVEKVCMCLYVCMYMCVYVCT